MHEHKECKRQVHKFVQGERGLLVRKGAETVPSAHRIPGEQKCQDYGQEQPARPADELQTDEGEPIHADGVGFHANTAAMRFNAAVSRQTAVTPRRGTSSVPTSSAPSDAPARSAA